ncbi:hypothetical protein FQN05_10685 [Corynebacterium aurimucosum]|uniref:Uncharacterized protein n=2 Tax=Corynebacterium TaxID=1716 RepID=A0A6I3KBX4_9CORY|nr:hypothetical protein [Corynebacterium aurimucosum]TRX58965.1 hypothetical protein FNY97_12095 [Corynebacterium aurimucosum]TVU81701.1 hypothetical protein FQN05_10685 [Corynebacterium aurimucosum]
MATGHAVNGVGCGAHGGGSFSLPWGLMSLSRIYPPGVCGQGIIESCVPLGVDRTEKYPRD